MNNNQYKKSMSGVHPSDRVVERIMNMTADKKKNNGLTLKRLAAAALAFALIIGGGFGTNAVIQNNKNKEQPFGIMVAYADEFLKVKSGTNQIVCKSIYIAPSDDAQKCKEQRAQATKDYNENREVFDKLAKMNKLAHLQGIGVFDETDKQGNITTKIYTTGAGFFVANKTDYENVKSFTVENESDDGYLQFEWSDTTDLIESITEENVNEENPYEDFINHKFILTGEQLRKSQNSYNSYNEYGYCCEWKFTPECFFREDGRYDKDFDVKSIKDKITFTFEYNDGTVESASVDISFDNNGHMIID